MLSIVVFEDEEEFVDLDGRILKRMLNCLVVLLRVFLMYLVFFFYDVLWFLDNISKDFLVLFIIVFIIRVFLLFKL